MIKNHQPLWVNSTPTFITLSKVDSTNSWLKRHQYLFKDQFYAVRAIDQFQGRGRHTRVWDQESSRDLTMSVGFILNTEREKAIAELPLFTAVSLHKFLSKKGLDSKIKWPNDLLIEKKKLCGILCEAIWNKTEVLFIVGVGLNVNSKHQNANNKNYSSTSIIEETKVPINISEFFRAWTIEFKDEVKVFLDKGITPYLTYLNENLFLYNQKVSLEWRVDSTQREFTGILKKVDSKGRLNIELSSNELLKLTHGEVSLKKI